MRVLLAGVGHSRFSVLPCGGEERENKEEGAGRHSWHPSDFTVEADDVQDIACGLGWTCGWAVDGKKGACYEWGTAMYNERLSRPPANSSSAYCPVKVPQDALHVQSEEPDNASQAKSVRVVSLACGPHFVLAATADGEVVSWGGDGSSGVGNGGGAAVLGQGSCERCGACQREQVGCDDGRTAPHHPSRKRTRGGDDNGLAVVSRVRGLKDRVVCVAAGERHAVAVTSNGTAFSWGNGDCGQLGIGPLHSDVTARGGGLIGENGRGGEREEEATACGPGAGVPSATIGSTSGLSANGGAQALDTDVPTCQHRCKPSALKLLEEYPNVKIVSAACGKDHTALLSSDGRVLTCGSGLYGQLGTGGMEAQWVPQVVEGLIGVGDVVGQDGVKYTSSTTASPPSTGIKSIACGGWHCVALSTAGEVYTWGWGRFGQLGDYRPKKERGKRAKGAVHSGGAGDDDGDSAGNDEEGHLGEVCRTPRLAPALMDFFDQRGGEGGELGLGLGDDDEDEVIKIAGGSRYTVVCSKQGRAAVVGQIAPPVLPEYFGAGEAGRAMKERQRPPNAPRGVFEELGLGLGPRSCGGDSNSSNSSSKSIWRVENVWAGPWAALFALTHEEPRSTQERAEGSTANVS